MRMMMARRWVAAGAESGLNQGRVADLVTLYGQARTTRRIDHAHEPIPTPKLALLMIWVEMGLMD